MNNSTMLLNNLYRIESLEIAETRDKITAHVRLNKEHYIFEGHFPGNPILPGVCTVQIIRELLQKALEKELQLSKAGNIKYLGFISPVATPELQFDLTIKNTEQGSVNCSATVSAAGNTLCSFKGEYLMCKWGNVQMG